MRIRETCGQLDIVCKEDQYCHKKIYPNNVDLSICLPYRKEGKKLKIQIFITRNKIYKHSIKLDVYCCKNFY